MERDYFAEAVAITKAHRDALIFSPRPITRIPYDPVAHATNAITDASSDFMFVIAEAFNAQDADGLREVCRHIAQCADAMRVVESMAQDFLTRIKE